MRSIDAIASATFTSNDRDLPALCTILQDSDTMIAYEGPFDDTTEQTTADQKALHHRTAPVANTYAAIGTTTIELSPRPPARTSTR